jgi:monoamine oxidase
MAGRETAERWMGYVDGAIEAGSRAAAEVLENPS